MAIPSPLHSRTSPLCSSQRWKDWAGFYAVCSYGTCHEEEYIAIRHACALLDVSPLYKYTIEGPEAGELLARILCRDPRKLAPGRVSYSPWTDERGRLLDDGTVTRLSDTEYRLTAAEPALAWLLRNGERYDANVEDVTERLAALALQGPTSKDLLNEVCDTDLNTLRFFGHTRCRLGDSPVEITRTGYTGDLGYELWLEPDVAPQVWDLLMERGGAHGIRPTGLDALDMSRIEAGFILQGVDYFSARHCEVDAQTSTPLEMGLGWAVDMDREPFIGQEAMRRELKHGSRSLLVGLNVDWEEIEGLYAARGLAPNVPVEAWRSMKPVFVRGKQVGRATSGTFSPTLKKNIALASVDPEVAHPGQHLTIEVTVEYERLVASATVTPLPFYNPPRKRGLA